MMIRPQDFWVVYDRKPGQKDGEWDRKVAGKFFYDGRIFSILENHNGILDGRTPDGPATPADRRFVDKLAHDIHTDVKSKQQFGPDPVQTKSFGTPFSVQDGPTVRHLQTVDGQPHLDGQPLSQSDVSDLLSRARKGHITVRYAHTPDSALAKFEDLMISLQKDESVQPKSLADVMEGLRQLVAKGHVPSDYYEKVRQELFTDELVPGIGNRKAFQEHLAGGTTPGTYLVCDLNTLKGVNDLHGHSKGDDFIKSAGQALRRAVDQTLGSDKTKVWRTGGDEFVMHVLPTGHIDPTDPIPGFLRKLRSELESVPPAGGTHPLSFSVGVGADPHTADSAMYKAKVLKSGAIVDQGGNPEDRKAIAPHSLYVYSLMPGREGAVPVRDESPMVESK